MATYQVFTKCSQEITTYPFLEDGMSGKQIQTLKALHEEGTKCAVVASQLFVKHCKTD